MKKTKIGIVGCGAIGRELAFFVQRELQRKTILCALSDKNWTQAKALQKELIKKPAVLDISTLIKKVDFIIESASKEVVQEILKGAIKFKKDVLIVSVGGIIQNMNILNEAEKNGIKVYITSGAICGIDGIGASSFSMIEKIELITSKPPEALLGAKFLEEKRIDILKVKKEKVIFTGGVDEAIKYFPQNINVAAALLLASSFYRVNKDNNKKVKVSIKVNPNIKRNVHRIELNAKDVKFSIEVENLPSKTNPKTSTLAILSTQYLLKKIFSSVKIGS